MLNPRSQVRSPRMEKFCCRRCCRGFISQTFEQLDDSNYSDVPR